MVAKLKSQKRATVGSTGAAALSRSKSAGVGSVAPAGDDKHANLKKRLESFNKLKTEKEDGSTVDAPPAEEEEKPKKAVPPLRKAQTEKSLPSNRRSPGDALLDKDSSDEEAVAAPVKKAAEFSVGEKLEALYLEDGLW